MQSGSSDCGLFALAFATALANGVNPFVLFFDQSKMRNHFQKAIDTGMLSMFPILKERRIPKICKAEYMIKVYCSCRMPEMNVNMIQCSSCREWFHIGTCSTVQSSALAKSAKWFCSDCN